MIFSQKQIEHAHILLTEQNMTPEQISETLGTRLSDVKVLIKEVWKQYERPKKAKKQRTLKRCHDAKKDDLTNTKPVAFVRPKAEYSNKRLYDLI